MEFWRACFHWQLVFSSLGTLAFCPVRVRVGGYVAAFQAWFHALLVMRLAGVTVAAGSEQLLAAPPMWGYELIDKAVG